MVTPKLVVLNKPYGVICQFSHHDKYPTLKQFIPMAGVYPAGRLDTDSEGLLVLTSDGRLQAKIAHPKYKLIKTYWAQVEGIPNPERIQNLRGGVNLGDFITQPAQVRLLNASEYAQLWSRIPPIRVRKTVSDFWLELRISEGKNRQVRRMCAKVGWPCLRLVRVGIGKLNIFTPELPLGHWREISEQDLLRR